MGKTMALRARRRNLYTQGFSFLRTGHYKKLLVDIQHKQLVGTTFGAKQSPDRHMFVMEICISHVCREIFICLFVLSEIPAKAVGLNNGIW